MQDSSWNPSHVGDGSARQTDGGSVTRLASIDSFDSKWLFSLLFVLGTDLHFLALFYIDSYASVPVVNLHEKLLHLTFVDLKVPFGLG